MSITGVNQVPTVAMRNNNQVEKSHVKHDAIVGAATTTAIGAAAVGVDVFPAKGVQKSLKNSTVSDKRKFLEKVGTEGKCYAKSVRNRISKYKNPLVWLGVIGAGLTIGGLIGLIRDKK